MELRHLRTFLAIAEEGSVSSAARRLFTTQPALTRQLAQLEAALGTQLFDRHSSGMSLTDAGRRLSTEASRLLADADSLVDQFRSDHSFVAGRLDIAVPEEGLGPLTPIVLSAFRAAFPNVSVNVDDACEFPAVAELVDARASPHDLALWGTSPNVDELRSHEVYREEVRLAVGADSALAHHPDPIEVADVLEEPFLDLGEFIRNWATSIFLDDFRNGSVARLSSRSSGFALESFDAISAGRAVIGMTPMTDVPGDVVLKPLRLRPTAGIGVIHRDRTENPHVRPFTQIATAVGRELWSLVPGALAPVTADT